MRNEHFSLQVEIVDPYSAQSFSYIPFTAIPINISNCDMNNSKYIHTYILVLCMVCGQMKGAATVYITCVH